MLLITVKQCKNQYEGLFDLDVLTLMANLCIVSQMAHLIWIVEMQTLQCTITQQPMQRILDSGKGAICDWSIIRTQLQRFFFLPRIYFSC